MLFMARGVRLFTKCVSTFGGDSSKDLKDMELIYSVVALQKLDGKALREKCDGHANGNSFYYLEARLGMLRLVRACWTRRENGKKRKQRFSNVI